MSPNQYRALEALAAAGTAGLPITSANTDTTIHRDTAAALERRGLAIIEHAAGLAFVTITGCRLLTVNTRQEATG